MNKHTCNHVWMACIHFIHFFVDNRSERSFACECIWVCMQTERHNKTPFLFSVSMSLLLLLHTGQAKKKERCRENLRERLRVCSCWYTTWAWPSCMCLGNRNECEKNVLRVKAFAWEEMLFIGIQMEDQVWSPAQLSPLKDTLRECLFSWYAFLCFNGLENFDIFYIRHNNIHGNDLLDSSVENLHLVCYTESLVVVLFLLPHKRGRNLK